MQYDDVKVASGVRGLMRRVLKAYESAQPLMDEAIEENARTIMTKVPIATEYVQAMGSWTFTVELKSISGQPYYRDKGRLVFGFGDEDRIQPLLDEHHDGSEGEHAVCAEHCDQLSDFSELLAGHTKMMDEFTSMFGDGLNPMRFSADGPKITDW